MRLESSPTTSVIELTCHSGQKLTIKATGNFKDKVEKGFKMHLQVKYGLITLINQEADGCDTIGKADLECPLDKGEMTLSKDVDLPQQIPPVCFITCKAGYRRKLTKPRAHTRSSPTSTPKTATRSLA